MPQMFYNTEDEDWDYYNPGEYGKCQSSQLPRGEVQEQPTATWESSILREQKLLSWWYTEGSRKAKTWEEGSHRKAAKFSTTDLIASLGHGQLHALFSWAAFCGRRCMHWGGQGIGQARNGGWRQRSGWGDLIRECPRIWMEMLQGKHAAMTCLLLPGIFSLIPHLGIRGWGEITAEVLMWCHFGNNFLQSDNKTRVKTIKVAPQVKLNLTEHSCMKHWTQLMHLSPLFCWNFRSHFCRAICCPQQSPQYREPLPGRAAHDSCCTQWTLLPCWGSLFRPSGKSPWQKPGHREHQKPQIIKLMLFGYRLASVGGAFLHLSVLCYLHSCFALFLSKVMLLILGDIANDNKLAQAHKHVPQALDHRLWRWPVTLIADLVRWLRLAPGCNWNQFAAAVKTNVRGARWKALGTEPSRKGWQHSNRKWADCQAKLVPLFDSPIQPVCFWSMPGNLLGRSSMTERKVRSVSPEYRSLIMALSLHWCLPWKPPRIIDSEARHAQWGELIEHQNAIK